MSFNVFATLPCEEKINFLSLQIGSVFFYKDETISKANRWHFLVGHNEGIFYFVHPQSNIESRLAVRNETRGSLKTLVIADSQDYPELTWESVFDCNTVRDYNRDWLISICKNGLFDLRSACSSALKQKICGAIEQSLLVSDHVKEIIKRSQS